MTTKEVAREQALARRNAIPAEAWAEKNDHICKRLFSEFAELLSANSPVIAVYNAFKSEVSLDPFINEAYGLGARVCFPCMTKKVDSDGNPRKKSYMVFREVSAADYRAQTVAFIENPLRSYEIDHPYLEGFPLIENDAIDAVVVPLVAYDNKGNRLGYGGGNYDHFLPQVRNDSPIVGVAFVEQCLAEVPAEETDFVLPKIISS